MERIRPDDYLEQSAKRRDEAKWLLSQVGKVERNRWRGRYVTQALTLILLSEIADTEERWRRQQYANPIEEQRAQGKAFFCEELLGRIEQMARGEDEWL